MTLPVDNPPKVLRVFQDEIGRQLIDEAKRLYPDAIQFHFNCPVESVDTAKQTVSVPKGSPTQVPARLTCNFEIALAFNLAKFTVSGKHCLLLRLLPLLLLVNQVIRNLGSCYAFAVMPRTQCCYS